MKNKSHYLTWKSRNREPLTPEQLIHILNQIYGGEQAKEIYRRLTGKEPPEDKASEVGGYECEG